jgi:hypothetical protein
MAQYTSMSLWGNKNHTVLLEQRSRLTAGSSSNRNTFVTIPTQALPKNNHYTARKFQSCMIYDNKILPFKQFFYLPFRAVFVYMALFKSATAA